jgi:hypothetical protein
MIRKHRRDLDSEILELRDKLYGIRAEGRPRAAIKRLKNLLIERESSLRRWFFSSFIQRMREQTSSLRSGLAYRELPRKGRRVERGGPTSVGPTGNTHKLNEKTGRPCGGEIVEYRLGRSYYGVCDRCHLGAQTWLPA